MNARERFRRVAESKEVDRLPFYEFLGFWYETVNRWYGEGLPRGVSAIGELGLVTFEPIFWTGTVLPVPQTLSEYFGFDARATLMVDFTPIPRFTRRVLEEDERVRVEVDEVGITRKVFKLRSVMPGWIDYPVRSREDFAAIRSRFDPDDPRRLPKGWCPELFEYYDRFEGPVGLTVPGFFGELSWRLMGIERLSLALYQDPDFVREVLEFWESYITRVLQHVLGRLTIDFVVIWEDMAYKAGPHISPRLFKEFFLPHYRGLVRALREGGVRSIIVDSDGNLGPLLPLLVEVGVNGLLPLEAAAGMDPLAIKEEYGDRLLLIGGIDKRALLGGRAAIEREVDSKVPAMVELGGCIPSIDHEVPPDISLENYLYYVNYLKERLVAKR
jgi:uroporphyrinogen decarboxylase